MTIRRVGVVAGLLVAGISQAASGQQQPRVDPATVATAQREAMAKLAAMDGVWRGSAWVLLPSGERHTMTQTERVGPFLDGAVKVIEGRGYDADGTVTFNAFAVVSYNTETRAYNMRSYAQGRAGDFTITPTADGFVWEIPAGPSTIRYTAVISGGTWRESGDRITPGQAPVRFIELNLTRVGDTNWPAAGAIPPK